MKPIYDALRDTGSCRHVISRVCAKLDCIARGKVFDSVYAGPASSHPEYWPVVRCMCGADMHVTRVADLRPDCELSKALDRLGVIGAQS